MDFLSNNPPKIKKLNLSHCKIQDLNESDYEDLPLSIRKHNKVYGSTLMAFSGKFSASTQDGMYRRPLKTVICVLWKIIFFFFQIYCFRSNRRTMERLRLYCSKFISRSEVESWIMIQYFFCVCVWSGNERLQGKICLWQCATLLWIKVFWLLDIFRFNCFLLNSLLLMDCARPHTFNWNSFTFNFFSQNIKKKSFCKKYQKFVFFSELKNSKRRFLYCPSKDDNDLFGTWSEWLWNSSNWQFCRFLL